MQRILEAVETQNKKTQAALDKMANENTKRHRIICQKIEELKSSLRHHQTGGYGEGDRSGLSEAESDQNGLTDATQVRWSGSFFYRTMQNDLQILQFSRLNKNAYFFNICFIRQCKMTCNFLFQQWTTVSGTVKMRIMHEYSVPVIYTQVIHVVIRVFLCHLAQCLVVYIFM